MKKFYLLMMFALLGMVANAQTFQKVTDVAQLAAGDKVIFISEEKSLVMTVLPSGGTYCNGEAINVNGGVAVVESPNVAILTLEQSDSYFSFNVNNEGKYLSTTGKGNLAQVETGNTNWTITITETGAVIENSEKSGYTIQLNRNTTPNRFACYNTDQGKIFIYKEVSTTQVVTPTFSVESGEIYPDTEIAINCATEGATIKYRLDEDPTVLDYSAPLVFTEIGKTVTVTAWAEAEGLEASEQAVATYNVVEKPATIEFTKVEDLSLLSTNDRVIIVCEDYNNAMSTTVSSNKIEPAEVSIDNGVINLPVNSTAAIFSVTSLGENTFTFSNGSNYLYSTGNKSTNLNYGTESNRINFTASNSENGILLTIGTDTRSVLFNGSVFGYYATSNVGSGYYVVSLYKEVVDENQVVAPTFSLTSGTYEGTQSLTMDCATEGATIYYTVNGGDTQTYTDAIELAEGEYAFVAWAEKDGMTKSSEVTANYTIVAPLVANSIAEFLTLGAENADREITLNCDLTVTYQGGGNDNTRDLYVKDAAGKGLLIFGVNSVYSNGNIIPAGLKGKLKDYNGLPELVNPSNFGEVSSGDEVSPEVFTAATITTDDLSKYIALNEVTLTSLDKNKNGTLTDASGDVVIRDNGYCEYPTDFSKEYDVTAVVAIYKETIQVYPVEIVEHTSSSVNDAVANEFKAVAVVNGIEVNVAEAGLVSVYNAAGQLVANVNVAEGATTINVAGGFYIVKVGNNVAKVLVK